MSAPARALGWYDETNFYKTTIIGTLAYGDLEFEQKGDVSQTLFRFQLVLQGMTKIINITPLLNHKLRRVCGNLSVLSMGQRGQHARFEGRTPPLATVRPGDLRIARLERPRSS